MVGKKFVPTKEMKAFIISMLDPDVEPTITAICKNAGISRTTYYNWFENEDFVNWFDKEWALAMTRQVSWLDKVGLARSIDDFKYWEAMQMKYGKFKKQQDITSGGEAINAILTNFDDPK